VALSAWSLPNASTPRCSRNRFSAVADISPMFNPEFVCCASLVIYVMGNGLSVSSIVDRLHALQPDERSEALNNLCEQVCYGRPHSCKVVTKSFSVACRNQKLPEIKISLGFGPFPAAAAAAAKATTAKATPPASYIYQRICT
jgi:hypothetical protein